MARRLIPEQAVADAEARLTAAVRAAVDDQRRSVKATMRSHGITASSAKVSVWSQSSWVKTVHTHVAPVASAVAVGLLAKAKGALPSKVAWGANVSTTAMASHVVNTALGAGERLGTVLANAADGADPMAAVDEALDSAAGWVADMAGRLASAVGNWVTSDLLTHAADQSVLSYTVTWNTVGDDKVRDDHDEADGQTVPAGEYFSVGGEDLLFPGDPQGSDGNTINCRCYLTFDDGSSGDSIDSNADTGE